MYETLAHGSSATRVTLVPETTFVSHIEGPGGGVLPYKSDGGTRWKISRTPLNGTNSTTTNYITGTANFNSNKDNFRTLSSQGLFESIVINLTDTTLAAVILGLSTLSGTPSLL